MRTACCEPIPRSRPAPRGKSVLPVDPVPDLLIARLRVIMPDRALDTVLARALGTAPDRALPRAPNTVPRRRRDARRKHLRSAVAKAAARRVPSLKNSPKPYKSFPALIDGPSIPPGNYAESAILGP